MNAKIGFTGTQKGMTSHQKSNVREMLIRLTTGFNITEAHHGDCIGADAEFHGILREVAPQIPITIHPPENESKRAFCTGTTVLEAKPYLERNHLIVNSIDILIAAPGEMEEQIRSGTWATVRYARKAHA